MFLLCVTFYLTLFTYFKSEALVHIIALQYVVLLYIFADGRKGIQQNTNI